MNTPELPNEQRLHDQLQVGFDEADRGEVAEWDLEAFLAKMHGQEAVEGIREGLAEMERGEGIPLDEAFDEIRRRHHIPPNLMTEASGDEAIDK